MQNLSNEQMQHNYLMALESKNNLMKTMESQSEESLKTIQLCIQNILGLLAMHPFEAKVAVIGLNLDFVIQEGNERLRQQDEQFKNEQALKSAEAVRLKDTENLLSNLQKVLANGFTNAVDPDGYLYRCTECGAVWDAQTGLGEHNDKCMTGRVAKDLKEHLRIYVPSDAYVD